MLRGNTMWQCCRSFLRLLVTANVAPSSPILVTLTMKAIRSSETSVLTRATQRNIQEDGILYSHRCENLKLTIVDWYQLVQGTQRILECYSAMGHISSPCHQPQVQEGLPTLSDCSAVGTRRSLPDEGRATEVGAVSCHPARARDALSVIASAMGLRGGHLPSRCPYT
jgi:hypothetical protein